MTNSAELDQLASKPPNLNLHCLQRQGISGFSRTKVKSDRTQQLLVNKSKCPEGQEYPWPVPFF